jgi:hypothetical protein
MTRLIPGGHGVSEHGGRAMKKIPLNPPHPERICWGCDLYCPADDLRCGNGTVRTMHPCELFGDDWLSWSGDREGGILASRPPELNRE